MAAASSNEFQLVVPETAKRAVVHHISGFTVPCHLSPNISAVDMEIRWFKETDCACLYKNRHIIEGRSYIGKVKQFTEGLEKGDVSLSLTHFSGSDLGDYVCQVTSGGRTEEITVRVNIWRAANLIRLAFSVFDIAEAINKQHGTYIINIDEINRTWTEDERLKMKDSVLMADDEIEKLHSEVERLKNESSKHIAEMSEKERLLENTVKELETSKHQLEKLRNVLQDMSRQNELLKSSAPVRRNNSMELDPPYMSGETASVFVSGSELRLVLLGSAGCEKSSAGNIILNREKNQTDTSAETQQSESRQEEVDGKQVTVVETPDWFCPELSLEEVRQDVRRCIRLSAPGPHAFLLVIPVQQSTGVKREMMEEMGEIFGERCWRNTMILFTVTDEEQKKNIEGFIQSENQEVQRLVEKCGNRFHGLNIHQSGGRVSDQSNEEKDHKRQRGEKRE
ncbi:uncharacterized protein LOC130551236 isoform X2 [Triplophysa rosa]|uniref:uncharacterized protein LOC130551236 isoform X2 n=1 Tax=Triplophysa rosa TaxID=992332 RepID=UPI0025461F8E|nr:uncharacterized protein LOC130551236 isoform X2 [Triplophysa rosa]